MSPDAISPYPDRPIRPLPKRRLRERLSPGVAESIKYPPAPKATTPLFYHPYNVREEVGTNSLVESQHPSERERADEIERNYISRRNGEELESDEDESAYRSRIYSRHSVHTTGRSYRYVQKPDSKHPNPHPPASTTSSADGYDSFENTNNKKKRKIPTPGDSNLNGVHLLSDVAGTPGPDDIAEDTGTGTYHGSGNVGQGISGPGRGRYGRIRNGRSPLRTLSDASSNWGNGRTTKQRQPQWPASSKPSDNKRSSLTMFTDTIQAESPGIISRSIANANAEKSPITPARGQENVSLLQQQASKKSSPASAQFTFTCDSQIPGTVAWPGPSTTTMHQSPAIRNLNTQATQTSPNMATTPHAPEKPKQSLAASQHAPNTAKQSPTPAEPAKRPRRTAGKEYLIAARERRHAQQFKNYHNPPAPEDIWICEFCEYERIFGGPPKALIRQYEIKDRRAKKQEAEKRRLLEKAKMKGRKKKGNKAAPKPSHAANNPPPAQQPQPPSMNQSQSQSQGTQSEEYYEEECDDEYVQDGPPPPSPVAPSTPHRNAVVQPDPGKQSEALAEATTVPRVAA
jgi:rubrerythrin